MQGRRGGVGCEARPNNEVHKVEPKNRGLRAVPWMVDALALAVASALAERGAGREEHMKLNIKAFALALALIWGLGLFVLTWWIILFEGPDGDIPALGLVYRGYTITPIGSLVGLAWGFADALVCGAIFAWLYNRIAAIGDLR